MIIQMLKAGSTLIRAQCFLMIAIFQFLYFGVYCYFSVIIVIQMLKGSKVNTSDNVKVVVRVRPPLLRELDGQIFISTVQVLEDSRSLQLFEYYNLQNLSQNDLQGYIDDPRNFNRHEFTFDHVYDDEANQEQVYKNTARLSVCSALEGYNATIFAYGQTGTGKTYTMEGFQYNLTSEKRGIIPRAIEDIFTYTEECSDQQEVTFMVRASYIQIYNENVSDLLRHQKKNLQIREDPKKGVYIEGVSEWAVVRPEEILELMKLGTQSRVIAKTNMNVSSSRSHAVFIITIEQMKADKETQGKEIKVAKLNLVDLAGSERVRVSGATGKRLQECKNINVSLSCLGMVIAALTENKPNNHIPYRNSVLTRLLSDSLGGNCKTTMLTMISPSPQAFLESLSSLKFAHRAKSIKNRPSINEDLDQKALIRKYENQLIRLRIELDQKNKVLIDKSKLIQLEEEKKKIQQDKNNVIKALQQRSHQFYKERQQKKLLQEKIKAFNSQLIHVGKDSFQRVVEEQKRLINQYQRRIKSLQSEKGNSPNSDLFDRQNQILMSLAAKLNERDEVNMHLNEQLCAYDRITKESEQNLQRKSHRIQQLQKLLRKHKIAIPDQSHEEVVRTKEERVDGVYLEGEMTYNVTQKNLMKTKEEVAALKEVNGQQKEEIVRLKEELKMKEFQKESLPKGEVDGYKKIKESIEMITRGLQKKENTDMKSIISEIFKIKKVVNDYVAE